MAATEESLASQYAANDCLAKDDVRLAPKWLLNQHFDSGNQKEFSYEQLDGFETELKVFIAEFVNQVEKLSGKNKNHSYKELGM